MSYFSRLSDIVTCNLSKLLVDEEKPRDVLEQIIFEMEEGRAGADRCVNTARNSESQLESELKEQQDLIQQWSGQAKQHLTAGEDEQARLAIQRKQELEALVAGLEQQHQAAIATREHLETTQKALHARIAEAKRKLQELETGESLVEEPAKAAAPAGASTPQVEQELEALRRELEQGS